MEFTSYEHFGTVFFQDAETRAPLGSVHMDTNHKSWVVDVPPRSYASKDEALAAMQRHLLYEDGVSVDKRLRGILP